MLRQLTSGGQTGVDRAALDVALRLGLACGGWCPKGRLAEDGIIPPCYPLRETPTAEYAERTAWNVRDSDGTLILACGPPSGGTAYTLACASKLGRPCHIEDFGEHPSTDRVLAWMREHAIQTLNVAGPRSSAHPGIYALAADFLETLILDAGRRT